MQHIRLVLVPLALTAVACGDDGSSSPVDRPSFLVASAVYSDEGTATYLNYESSLDIPELDRNAAIELIGPATIAGYNGSIYIGDGEAPIITKYVIGDDNRPEETGRVSFVNEGGSSELYANWFASPTRASLDLSGDERLLWNPSDMTVVGTLAIPGLTLEHGDKEMIASYDRGVAVRPGRAYQPFYWANFDFYTFHPSSQIAVIDTDNDTVLSMIDAPCPGLDVATKDEAGNVYIGPWTFSQLLRVNDTTQPENCVVKIPVGSDTIDPTFTRSFASLTGGMDAGALRNVGNGVVLLSVLDPSLIPPGTSPEELSGLSIWRLWRVDLATWTGAPIGGLEPFDGGYYAFLVDDKAVVLLPFDDYASTQAFEIPPTGDAIKRFTTVGWAYQMIDID